MKHLFPIVFITLAVGAQLTFASSNEIEMELKSFIPKLNDESVICVYRDSHGFLWVGTYIGLFRTDGTDTQVFLNNPNDSSSISSSVVNVVFEDSHGSLWLGNQRGLDQYDYDSERFIHHIPSVLTNNWTYKEIRDIAEDRSGNLWLATYNNYGLIKYNYNTKKEKTYMLPDFSGDQRINTVESTRSEILIGTELKGLFTLDLSTDSIKNIVDNFHGNVLTINDIKIVDNEAYMGTWDNGLVSYNIISKKLIWHSENTEYSQDFSGKNVRQIAVDAHQNLWLAISGNGISCFDIKNKTVKIINNKYDLNSETQRLQSWCIFIDNQGILWFGSMEKGLKMGLLSHTDEDYLKFENKGEQYQITNIVDAVQDNYGNIWIATAKQGLIKYDVHSKIAKRVELLSDSKKTDLLCLMMDKLDRLWISTSEGIFIINPKSNKTVSTVGDICPLVHQVVNSPSFMYCDHDGDVWLAAWQTGLIQIPYSQLKDPLTKILEPNRYQMNETISNSILNNNLTNVFQSVDGTVYVSGSYFIQKFYKQTQKFEIFTWFDGASIAEDINHHIWISSNAKGVIDYNPKDSTFNLMSSDYPGKATAIGVFADNSAIWVKRKNDFIRINSITDTINYYKKDVGIRRMSYYSTSILTSNNNIFIGGEEGAYFFNPEITKSSPLPKIRASHIFIYNKQVQINDTIDGRILQTKSLDKEESITIPSGIKSFSIEFSCQDFLEPEEIVYAYKLQGFDTAWTFMDYPNRTAVFNNLDGGDYELHMAIYNPFTDWKKNSQILKIKVITPFYKTILFKIISVVFLILIVLAIFSMRQARLKKLNKVLEDTILMRTKELRNSNTHLVKQTNMLNKINEELTEKQKFINDQTEEIKQQRNALRIKNEELIELNAAKDKFFSIIGHDLKSPIGAILGVLNIINEGYDSLTEVHIKDMIKSAANSSQTIFNLVENLLYWSRSVTENIEFNPQEINISELINNNLNIGAITGSEKNIRINSILDDTGLIMIADIDMINFVIRNLLNNAIKFTPFDGNITLSVKKELDEIIVCVQDNGIGMPQEKIDTLFKMSKQISTEGTNREVGTGLGLILCKDFIDRHHGKIWVESKVGVGSSFYFSLPQ